MATVARPGLFRKLYFGLIVAYCEPYGVGVVDAYESNVDFIRDGLLYTSVHQFY